MEQRSLLIAWLQDAYAMENALEKVLENHASDTRDHPQLQVKIREHLQATRRHAEMVRECLERNGDTASTVKTGIGSLVGWMQGLSTDTADDELVKNLLADYAAEHFEIVCYRALIVAAEEIGDSRTASTCREILEEEETMANWLGMNIPSAVREMMQKRSVENQAGR